MSFPTVATLLDGFNRGAIGAAWTTPTYGDVALVITGGSVLQSSGSFGAGYLNTASYGPGIEFYSDIASNLGGFQGLMYHLNSGGTDAAPNGYEFNANANGTLERVDAGSNTLIGASFILNAPDIAVGDKVGISVDSGGTHSFYYFKTGAWNLMATRTETTYTSGFFGFELNGGNQVDNLSGGTATSGTAYTGDATLARSLGFSADATKLYVPGAVVTTDYLAFPKIRMRTGARG